MSYLVGCGARFDNAGPKSDKRSACASLVVGRFVFSVWRVAGIGPGRAERAVAFDGPRRNIGRSVGRFRAAAVIGQKQHERIVPFAELFYFCQHPAYSLVHAVHHCGIHGHSQVGLVFLRITERVPARHTLIAWRQRIFRVDQAHLYLTFVALPAKLVPADLVFAAVPGDIIRPGVQRVMGCRIRQVQQERLVFIPVLFKPINRIISEGVGSVEVLIFGDVPHNLFAFDGPTARCVPLSAGFSFSGSGFGSRVPEITASVRQAVIPVEAASCGQRRLVPFARGNCSIADSP